LVLSIYKKYVRTTGSKGYRFIVKKMRLDGYFVSIRWIRKILLENNLLARQRVKKKYSSYKNDGNKPLPNYLLGKKIKDKNTGKYKRVHFFNPTKKWSILATDVTEFHFNGIKVYLSAVIDLYDSLIVNFRISKHPDKELILGTLNDLLKIKPNNRLILHSDQGCIYRADEWKTICSKNNIFGSMSRKGKSSDNAPMEGWFGRLKQEWFNLKNFSNYSFLEFAKELENEIIYQYKDRFNEDYKYTDLLMFSNLYEQENKQVA
jgi:putative transposase